VVTSAVKAGAVAKAPLKIVKAGQPGVRPPQATNVGNVAKPKALAKSAPKAAAKAEARVVRRSPPARKLMVKKAARRRR
jgi:hypothetical protein